MSLSTITDFDETGVSATDFDAQKIVQANSSVLSADVNTLLERALRRTRFLYNGGPFPTGITITQSTVNGNALTATGNGTGAGVRGTGGASSGAGLVGIGGATNGPGVTGEGTGTGRGGSFLGGATGPGLLGVGGGGNSPGVQGQAAGTGPAFEALTGGFKYSGTQPAVTADPGTNTTHATGACKAWALITTDGAGNVSAVDGLNIASVAISSATLTVALVNGFAGTAYAVFLSSGNTPVSAESVVYEWNRSASSGSSVVLYGRRVSAGAVANINFETTVNTILVQVLGRQ
jgi:hypothetical protein